MNTPLISSETSSLYVHIPFCRHRCGYCAFAVSTQGQDDRSLHQRYIQGVGKELARRLHRHQHLDVRTLYIGGGTPSRLHPDDMKLLFKTLKSEFSTWSWEEVTFELNPEDLEIYPNYPKRLQDEGVTRLSLGTQTTSAEGLKVLERKTTPDQVLKSVQSVREQFEGSLSLDLIMGWPGQTLEMLEKDDLPFLDATQPDHLSIYMLNVEPGTKLERDRRKGLIQLLDDDTSATLWERLLEHMNGQGYEHYEISNFCRPGHASLHNTLTWRGHPYLGIGTGAVSQVGKVRWTNMATPELYLKKCDQVRWPVATAEFITDQIRWEEALLLGLRHQEGLKLNDLESLLAKPLPKTFVDSVQTGLNGGDLSLEENLLKFTQRGWSRFDAWISDWMGLLESC
jgi:putative oxygen-independent coproporphyrinogen III oxidase